VIGQMRYAQSVRFIPENESEREISPTFECSRCELSYADAAMYMRAAKGFLQLA